MNSSPARVGLIGLGGYALEHLAILGTIEGAGLCRLVGAADPFPERHLALVSALESRGARVDSEVETLLARDDVDAVFIASPIHWHARHTIAALEAGKAVYLEKPPCATLGEWMQMRAAQQQSGRVCAIGFQMQASSALRFLKSEVARGAIGRLHSGWVSVRWARDDSYYARASWAGCWNLDGAPVFDGPATNALAHTVHALLSLAGENEQMPEIVRVRGTLRRARPIESYDSALVEAQTQTGVHLRWALTHATELTDGVVLRLRGDQGQAQLSWNGRVEISGKGGTEERQFLDHPAWGATLNFLRALDSPGATPYVSLEDTLPYLQTVNGALQSSRGARHFPPLLTQHNSPSGFYRVQGLDEELAAFADDFHAPPPLLCDESNPWIEVDTLSSQLDVGND